MSNNYLKEIITKEVIELKHQNSGGGFIDHLIQETDDPEFVNVCAKITRPLFEKLDSTCQFLSISKRRFIEAAIIQGLEQAEAIMTEYELIDHMQKEQELINEALKKHDEEGAVLS